jgi:hypothetical protein
MSGGGGAGGGGGDSAAGAAAAGVSAAASAPRFARIVVPRPTQRSRVDLANDGWGAPGTRIVPAAPAIVLAPADTGPIRYSPEQNMVELVDEPRAANAAPPSTNAMGASAVGQPVRVPRIEGRPLSAR